MFNCIIRYFLDIDMKPYSSWYLKKEVTLLSEEGKHVESIEKDRMTKAHRVKCLKVLFIFQFNNYLRKYEPYTAVHCSRLVEGYTDMSIFM